MEIDFAVTGALFSKDQCCQIALDNSILHTLHGKFQQISISGVGKVDIYLSFLRSIETAKFVGKVLRGGLVIIGSSSVIREVIADWLLCNLLLEEICLVQEKYDGGALEPG